MPQTEPETWFEGALCELVAHAILIPGMTWPQRYLMGEMDALLEARRDLPAAQPAPDQAADAFEHWLMARWLAHCRSAEYRASADYYFLRGEFEQGR